MSKSYSIDVFRRVHDDANGACITVSTDGEIPGNVVLQTVSKHDKEYFGDFRVSMDSAMADKLAAAIARCCEEI